MSDLTRRGFFSLIGAGAVAAASCRAVAAEPPPPDMTASDTILMTAVTGPRTVRVMALDARTGMVRAWDSTPPWARGGR